ncbi:hypothetical protein [Streptomyces sp. NPDC047043]|uniref:hypothetical protein n=1 Tax=Streptomyces sp. NPDC047043 TaxID=3154497 RepID=UPI00340AB576
MKITAVLALAALTAVTATGATALPAAAAEPATPTYDFSDCPEIPAGVDAAQWKCEVLTATGSLTLGSRTLPELAPMIVTHAEGPMPDGSEGQIFGALRSAPTRVPGSLPSLSLQPEYGGRSDFYSVGNSLGLFTMRFRVQSPLLPHDCTVGRDTPVELRLQRAGDSEWVSKNPPVVRFDAYDDTFSAPAATGCGPLNRLVNHRLGLPRATGNAIRLSATYTFKTYDQLHMANAGQADRLSPSGV